MKSNCGCFERILQEVTPLVRAENEVEDFKIDWRDSVFRFDGGCGIGLYIRAEYYKIKKNGDKFANKTKDDRFIALSFCPFCGEKLKAKRGN